jgi:hypothetical protein
VFELARMKEFRVQERRSRKPNTVSRSASEPSLALSAVIGSSVESRTQANEARPVPTTRAPDYWRRWSLCSPGVSKHMY